MSKLRCTIVTPEVTVLDGEYDSIVLPLFDGELGVLPGRAPMIGRLGYGEARLRHGDVLQTYYVDGGFAQVQDNEVSILTGQAKEGKTLDPAVLNEQLGEIAAKKTANEEEVVARERAVARARAQLHVAQKAAERF